MSLNLIQPDEEMPERILGVCGDCKAWFLLGGLGAATMRLLMPGETPRSIGGEGMPVGAMDSGAQATGS